ncbi:hypothetical protein [Leucobacter musarum]|uniref:hypothetical protein n=1 Tax=Leucobacter musarum TaxID=1930747 RepID=UPI0009499E95|nr:hypothetical protein [Leucobacter musarum]
MRAAAMIYRDAGAVPDDEKHLRLHGQYESEIIEGPDRATWVEAKAACEIPEGAMLLSWDRIE